MVIGSVGVERVMGGSRSKSSRGMCSRKDEEVSGEENGEGKVLEVPDWPGRWRRQELPEMRKEALLGRLASWGSVIGVA